ncbi:MAG: hypothetical protein PVI60_15785 [Desulfobacteraceae bacterium]|jgi:ABC-type amino acid transport substrate-binding protein
MARINIIYSEFPIQRLLLQLKRNEIDMALLLAKTPERAADFVYPSRPYISAQSAIAVEASSSPQQFNSRRQTRMRPKDFKQAHDIMMQWHLNLRSAF